jgi:hypothetical protein
MTAKASKGPHLEKQGRWRRVAQIREMHNRSVKGTCEPLFKGPSFRLLSTDVRTMARSRSVTDAGPPAVPRTSIHGVFRKLRRWQSKDRLRKTDEEDDDMFVCAGDEELCVSLKAGPTVSSKCLFRAVRFLIWPAQHGRPPLPAYSSVPPTPPRRELKHVASLPALRGAERRQREQECALDAIAEYVSRPPTQRPESSSSSVFSASTDGYHRTSGFPASARLSEQMQSSAASKRRTDDSLPSYRTGPPSPPEYAEEGGWRHSGLGKHASRDYGFI